MADAAAARLRRFHGIDRAAPVWILAAAALLLLILLPLGWLAYLSVGGEHGFTLAHYARVFSDLPLRRALWNTVVLAFWSGLLALAIGAPLAWLSARTDLPGRRLIQRLILASFVTPPFLGAFAWVMLAGPNAGYLNRLYRGLTGAEGPLLNIFTMPGLIFVVAIYTFPYVYIMIANTLGLIASDLEDAASILGAGRLQVARTITLPMVLPAVVSGFILAVLQALALFGSPAILALPAGFHTVTTQLWAFFQYPPRVEMAAAFSIPLLLATALLLLAQKQLLGRRGYAAIGGKGAARRPIPLGRWRIPALAMVLAVLACAVFLPYGILLKAAFSRAWAQPLTWDNATLENWSFTFLYSSTQSAIVNTIELGVLTACVGAALATLLAYVTNRKLVRGHQVLGFLALAPVVIPGVVLAVALFIAYTRPPFLLYGTLWILFLAYLTKEMPVGYSQADATLRGIHPELEEAGRILGAGRLRVLWEITAPLAKSGIIATWCFVFIGVIRELSASIILFTPNTKVMSVVIFDLKEEGQFGAIAVLGIFMLAMTFATVALMQTLLGRDVLSGRQSSGAG
ncbi:MAG TPA: iron ABC transporter permease [Candidatus Dormibacteraeota bacterium]|jgi:iron(III) transport system permease protein|nr:iron ABC transporter permease [Candidatus Dormibacteraeota bacterium]